MLSGYRTFAATAAMLGVTEEQVSTWVDGNDGNGPLVARVQADGRRLIHHDDLIAFRRPLGIATSSDTTPPPGSESSQPANPAPAGVVSPTTENDSPIMRPCGSSFQARRGTVDSAAYRAIANLPEVQRQGERFLGFVAPEPNTGCHIWTGCIDKRYGYGYFRLWPAKTIAAAHRFAWVLANNRIIPERADVDHAACSNRWCVNPAHLEVVTHAENVRRRDARRGRLGLPDNCAIARGHLRLVR